MVILVTIRSGFAAFDSSGLIHLIEMNSNASHAGSWEVVHTGIVGLYLLRL